MSIKSMNSVELNQKLENKEDIILIDCREVDEWNEAHVKEARLFPLSNFETAFEELQNKDSEIIIMCRSGKRSLNACFLLKEEGFTNLTNLEGGILSWVDNQFETISEN